jgi:GNAT superfamily N-acetyltransferase
MYKFVVLNRENAFQYDNLTYPSFRYRLRIFKPNESLIAIGVHLDDIPVGLVFTELLSDRSSAKVLSLFVVPEHRGQGLGKTLLTKMEQQLRQVGCSKVSLVYLPNSTTVFLEKILECGNWLSPNPRMLIGRVVILESTIQTADWVGGNATILDSSYAMFPWIELTQEERQNILTEQFESFWYPENCSPFKEEEKLEPINSIGLRYQNKIVGWMITHRIAPDTIRYTSLFVKKELQGIGRAIPLLAAAINSQLQHPDLQQATFAVDINNKLMVKFIQRRLAPHVTSIRQSMQSSKILEL